MLWHFRSLTQKLQCFLSTQSNLLIIIVWNHVPDCYTTLLSTAEIKFLHWNLSPCNLSPTWRLTLHRHHTSGHYLKRVFHWWEGYVTLFSKQNPCWCPFSIRLANWNTLQYIQQINIAFCFITDYESCFFKHCVRRRDTYCPHICFLLYFARKSVQSNKESYTIERLELTGSHLN